MWWAWNKKEDGTQAGGWRASHFGGNHVREDLVVPSLPPKFSIWRRAGLVVRVYDDDRVTLAECEWRPRV